ncbi:DksA/TraR family C4-type zinc finger protein [Jinshanibacter sp. LJY008]|uniref:DksA/TraR family C4-type zinc finger protein n=1 Tax=Limnobaculum eriocheiris TaxID=2897391 RepID=A0A9X1N113_9GAMM|nr:DksA/TraR family C4-type zinc finger protein [Limnobaculum eriocheiris]MCD1127392.1 DksA/TraR family C4-type zinc finger protein [Limnobaculum eriocheiris]
MASGWAADGAVQDQIDSTISDAVAKARSQLHNGESATHCLECGEPISQARREALPGVQYCLACQTELDKKNQHQAGYNRRGSKDSQLR